MPMKMKEWRWLPVREGCGREMPEAWRLKEVGAGAAWLTERRP